MKTVELPINEVNKSHSATDMNNLVEREAQMVQADKLENERINAKVSVNILDVLCIRKDYCLIFYDLKAVDYYLFPYKNKNHDFIVSAQNAVEEYVYDIRGRIYEELEKYISEGDREKLGRMLEDTENWLYEDGEDCKKQVYLDKLTELKVKYDLWNMKYILKL